MESLYKDLKVLETALNRAVGTSIFIIEEKEDLSNNEYLYRINLYTTYSRMNIFSTQFSLGRSLGEFAEREKQKARQIFIQGIINTLLYGLPTSKDTTDIHGRRLLTIQNFVIQEMVLQDLRRKFSNQVMPFKDNLIYAVDGEVKFGVDYNTLYCTIRGEYREYTINNIHEVASKLDEFYKFIYMK